MKLILSELRQVIQILKQERSVAKCFDKWFHKISVLVEEENHIKSVSFIIFN